MLFLAHQKTKNNYENVKFNYLLLYSYTKKKLKTYMLSKF